jgi:hypothetical protein
MRLHTAVVLLSLLAAAAGLGRAEETVLIEAGRDATLIEDPDGSLANGAGPVLFAGRTNQPQNGVRRALLFFDVASVIPKGAIIEEARLRLFMTPSNPSTRTMTLYRVQADWGEGPSSASGGSGAPAEAGDATWLHTFYDTRFWVVNGGHFIGRASAAASVSSSGYYTWESTTHLVRDVRLWVSAPNRNFGWVLIGDETARQTAKSFASRESSDPALRPVLEVTYRVPAARRGR